MKRFCDSMNAIMALFVFLLVEMVGANSATTSSNIHRFGFDPFSTNTIYRQQFALEFLQDAEATRSTEAVIDYSNQLLAAHANIPAYELSALYDLYNATDGPNWRWNPTNDTTGIPWDFSGTPNPCADNWQGVDCLFVLPSTPVTHVSKLVLDSKEMHGEIPSSFGNLSYLTYFSMFHNKVNGTLPDTLGKLWRLTYLDCTDNRIAGPLPETLSNLTNLQTFLFGSNRLETTVPTLVQNFKNLSRLGLAENRLTGSIPAVIGTLTKLKFLDMSNNHLEGTIPSEIGNLINLQLLWISNNSLSGSLPSTISNFHQITFLYVNDNNLDGLIPTHIGSLKNLLFFDLDNNFFTGNFPGSFAALNQLYFFGGYNNSFTGTVPTYFCDFKELRYLYMYENYYTGTLPSCLGDIPDMLFLYMHSNQFHGAIPTSLCNMTRLNALYLYNNHLSGTIPEAIGNLSSLHFLYLQSNALSGTVPQSISAMSQLITILLQGNRLTGSLDGVFDPLLQQELTTVQLSNNQFSGTLPDAIFQLPSISTFIAVSNCFTGHLKDSMCNATTLISLALDGLQSASTCRRVLLKHISSSYLSDKSLKGHVPSCLFAMPILNTLHLSGNGLTGSLSSDLTINDYLIDLTLSHNLLTGSIPKAIQERDWYNLDLSFNRFTGSLKLTSINTQVNFTYHIAVNSTNTITVVRNASSTALALENNRISGALPSAVLTMLNISILNGNLFSCKYDKSNLPTHDSGRLAYDCGSNSFTVPYYVWLSMMGLAAAVLLILLTRDGQWQEKIGIPNIPELLSQWLAATTLSQNILPAEVTKQYAHTAAVALACDIFKTVKQVGVGALVYILVVLMPLYCILSYYFGTHVHQYAWGVSAAFLSGRIPFLCMIVFFLVFVVYVIVLFKKLSLKFKGNKHFSLWRPTEMAQSVTREAQHAAIASIPFSERLCVHVCFISVNFVIVIGVNVAFVYIALYQSTILLIIAQILLSFFKVGWNVVCSRYIIRYIVFHCAPSSRSISSDTAVGYFPMQLFVGLFNNIAIPCLVVAVISPNCFYNMFDPADNIDSKYDYVKCQLQSFTTCLLYTPQVASTSYSPPFTYSYQCSSSFITYYAPAFVYLAITVTVLNPLLFFVLANFHKSARPGTVWFAFIDTVLPRIWKPVYSISDTVGGGGSGGGVVRTRSSQRAGNRAAAGSVDVTVISSLTDHTASQANSSAYPSQIEVGQEPELGLPSHCDNINNNVDAEWVEGSEGCVSRDRGSSNMDRENLSSLTTTTKIINRHTTTLQTEKDIFLCYFDANQVMIGLLTLLGILLTFGALFPPLAAALVLAIFAVVLYNKLKIGRFLTQAVEKNRMDLVRRINNECRCIGSRSILYHALWMMILFSCWFYSFFLFDTLGDSVGFKEAMWVLVVMALLPFVIIGILNFRTILSWVRTLPILAIPIFHTSDVRKNGKSSRHTDNYNSNSDVLHGDIQSVEMSANAVSKGNTTLSSHDLDGEYSDDNNNNRDGDDEDSEIFNVLQTGK